MKCRGVRKLRALLTPASTAIPSHSPTSFIEHLKSGSTAIASKNVIAGRGSDEGIDLLVRAFCRAGEDSVLICPPTFGMYKVSARIQGAGVIEVPLIKERGFELDVQAVLGAWHENVKLVFICTPEQSHRQSARPHLDRKAVHAT